MDVLPSSYPLNLADSPATSSVLGVAHDWEAIGLWLSVKTQRSAHTRRAYQREAQRFLTFLSAELGIQQLSEIKLTHIQAYLQHLAAPPAHWLIGHTPMAQRRPTQLLRSALAPQSIAYSRTVIGSLLDFLQQAGHVQANPVSLSAQPIVPKNSMADKALEPDAWLFFWRWLCAQHHTARRPEQQQLAIRNRWLCALLYHTGLRRSSIVAATMMDLYRQQGQWLLTVPIKGGQRHTVVIGQHLLAELKSYRQTLGWSALPDGQDQRPLLANLRYPDQPMTCRNVGRVFEQLTTQAAQACDDPYLAAQIAQLTAHGLRHTFATHSLMAGSRLEAVQDALGHRSITTTSIYAKSSRQMQIDQKHAFDRFVSELQQR